MSKSVEESIANLNSVNISFFLLSIIFAIGHTSRTEETDGLLGSSMAPKLGYTGEGAHAGDFRDITRNGLHCPIVCRPPFSVKA